MRRKRYQRGSVKPRKRGGKTYWYAQWREDGSPRSKELGLYSSMTRAQAEGILSEILQPINAAAGCKQVPVLKHTFGQFVEKVYLPVWSGRWKLSTAMTEVDRIKYHLIEPLGGQGDQGYHKRGDANATEPEGRESVHKRRQPSSISATVDFRVGPERRCCGPKSGRNVVHAEGLSARS